MLNLHFSVLPCMHYKVPHAVLEKSHISCGNNGKEIAKWLPHMVLKWSPELRFSSRARNVVVYQFTHSWTASNASRQCPGDSLVANAQCRICVWIPTTYKVKHQRSLQYRTHTSLTSRSCGTSCWNGTKHRYKKDLAKQDTTVFLRTTGPRHKSHRHGMALVGTVNACCW